MEFAGFSVHWEELQGCLDPTELSSMPGSPPFCGCLAPTGGSVRAAATDLALPLSDLEQAFPPL